MEGRQPPPKAKHTFPNNPNVYKFWGAPWGKTVMKSTFVGGCIMASLLAMNTYVTTGHPNIFGGLPPTKEEVLRKLELMRHQGSVMNAQLPVELVHTTNRNLEFDDGVKFNPALSGFEVLER